VDPNDRDPRTYAIIGAAMQVHRDLGRGFLESIYQNCLALRFREAKVPFEREKPLAVDYLGKPVGTFRADFVCYQDIVVELKAQTHLGPSDVAQLANYLAVTQQPLGVLLNFGAESLEFRRVIGRSARPSWPEEVPS
jgi:GxxExxY protein